MEAVIDFGEEEVEEDVFQEGLCPRAMLEIYSTDPNLTAARGIARRARDSVQSLLADYRRSEIVRSGVRLAIFGPPNAGKSTLLNFLGEFAKPRLILLPECSRPSPS